MPTVELFATAYGGVYLDVAAQNSTSDASDQATTFSVDGIVVDATSETADVNIVGRSGVLFVPETEENLEDIKIVGYPTLTFSDGVMELTGDPRITFTDGTASLADPENTRIEFSHNAEGDGTIRRDAGSWLDDGFRIGQSIEVEGTTLNNLTLTVAWVSDSVLTLHESDEVQDEQIDAGATIRSEGNAHTISRNIGTWTEEGFVAGQTITIVSKTGSENDGKTCTIEKVDGAVLTLSGTDELVDEMVDNGVEITTAQGAYAIRRSDGSWIQDGFAAGQTVTVAGTNANDGIYEVLDASEKSVTVRQSVADETIQVIGSASQPPNVSLTADQQKVVGEDTVQVGLPANAVYDIGEVFAHGGNVTAEVTGDMNLGLVAAAISVKLDVSASIWDAVDDSKSNVDSATAQLSAENTIGAATNPIETRVSKLEASAATGGIWLENHGDLEIGGITGVDGLPPLAPLSLPRSAQSTLWTMSHPRRISP